jgi:acetyl coenzyme A synthetase (ADP forming)-like protein
MKNFFEPKRIAVIGASRSMRKVGGVVFRNLLDAGFDIIPINPNARKVYGKRAYPSVLAYKKKIDLAVIVVPAQVAPWVFKDCAMKGIKEVIIISAGFSEASESGGKIERALVKMAEINGMKILGPNCLGLINIHNEMNISFFQGMPKKGNIAFISQSGALAVAMLDFAIKNDIGLSKFISVGNMAQIGFSDLIEYLGNDKQTECICMYVESLKNGKKFLQVAKKCKKPLVVIKAGKSERGKEAAASHTGALAGSAEIYSGAFRQAGIIEVDSVSSLFEVSQVISQGRPKGKRVCILTNAGGPGVLAADACEEFNLVLPNLPEKLKKDLDKKLNIHWSKSNPIDIIGDANSKRYRLALNEIIKHDFYDTVLIILTPQAMTDVENIAKIIISFKRKTKKAVFACFMGGRKIQKGTRLLKSKGITIFKDPRNAARAIALSISE